MDIHGIYIYIYRSLYIPWISMVYIEISIYAMDIHGIYRDLYIYIYIYIPCTGNRETPSKRDNIFNVFSQFFNNFIVHSRVLKLCKWS